MLEVEMLPAREGDCLWIRYGSARAPRQILIDAGRSATYVKELRPRLMSLPATQRTFELLVITHIDRDHIEGVLKLLEDRTLPIKFKDIWFNGYEHLPKSPFKPMGAVQGERLTAELLLRGKLWNKAWDSKAVVMSDRALPTVNLTGNLTLTLLSPDRQKLTALGPVWKRECQEAGLVAGRPKRSDKQGDWVPQGAVNIEKLAATPFTPEKKEPNGSSIAFLLEHDGKRVLLGADCHEDRLLSSVKRLAGTKKRLSIDLFKIPHHGSEGNISQALLDHLDCPRYLISTNGSYFKHPSQVAMARLLKFGGATKTLYFNYLSQYTKPWSSKPWQQRYGYKAVYPDKGTPGTLLVSL